MALRLMTPEDFFAVRSLLLPGKADADAQASIPDSTIQLPSVGGRAEALVMERLGNDWPFFAAGVVANIPAGYAQGDGTLAIQLFHDALVQFACAQLLNTGLAQQIIPSLIRTADQSLTLGVNWDQIRGVYMASGYQALALLRRPVPVAHRRFVSPSAGASGQMHRTIRPAALGCHRVGGWRDDDDCRW